MILSQPRALFFPAGPILLGGLLWTAASFGQVLPPGRTAPTPTTNPNPTSPFEPTPTPTPKPFVPPEPAPPPVLGTPVPEPPTLVELRMRYQAALRRSIAPLDNSYVQTLITLKQQFTKAGNLEAVLAVKQELDKITQAISETASRGPEVIILSALQRDAASKKNVVDVTAAVKKGFFSGAPTLGLNAYRDTGSSLSSPPPKRETVIIYTCGGERKEKILPERAELNFQKDLK